MSLNFVLRVNDTAIGAFEAVRVAGDNDPDSINTYDVLIDRLFTREQPFKPTLQRYSFTIEHRYGDGAWGLVRKAIEEAGSFLGGKP